MPSMNADKEQTAAYAEDRGYAGMKEKAPALDQPRQGPARRTEDGLGILRPTTAMFFVMPGLVPGIHISTALLGKKDGWPTKPASDGNARCAARKRAAVHAAAMAL